MKNPEISFFDLIVDFQDEMKKYGIEISSYSDLSKKMFLALPSVYKSFVMKKVIDQISILKNPSLIHSTKNETLKTNLMENLMKLGITLNDCNYNNLFLDSKDTIQLLDPSGMMLFCNWNFLVRTGYDLLILNLFSYQELFERSKRLGTLLESKMSEALKSETIQYGLALHTMKAHLAPHKNLLLCNLKQFVPLNSFNQNKKFIMIVSDIKKLGDLKHEFEYLQLSV